MAKKPANYGEAEFGVNSSLGAQSLWTASDSTRAVAEKVPTGVRNLAPERVPLARFTDAYANKETCTRYARSSLNTIWVGRTNLSAIKRSTSTVVMYIKAMASTE